MSFWYLQFSQKTNEKIRLYYYGTSSRIVFVRFLGELKTPKRHFEINWPLASQLSRSYDYRAAKGRKPNTHLYGQNGLSRTSETREKKLQNYFFFAMYLVTTTGCIVKPQEQLNIKILYCALIIELFSLNNLVTPKY